MRGIVIIWTMFVSILMQFTKEDFSVDMCSDIQVTPFDSSLLDVSSTENGTPFDGRLTAQDMEAAFSFTDQRFTDQQVTSLSEEVQQGSVSLQVTTQAIVNPQPPPIEGNSFQAGVFEVGNIRTDLRQKGDIGIRIMAVNMCGFKPKNNARGGEPIDINSVQTDLYSDVFDDRPGTLSHWIKVFSFGTSELPTNTLHGQVETIEERVCKCSDNCRPPREIRWLDEMQKIMNFRGQKRVLIVPNEVSVGPGGGWAGIGDLVGYNGVIARGYNVNLIMHELGHAMGMDHSGSACREVFTTVKPCPSGTSSRGESWVTNAEGDMTCLMGYGPGKLLNVVNAHIMKYVSPISTYVIDNNRNKSFTFILPAYELNQKIMLYCQQTCHLIILSEHGLRLLIFIYLIAKKTIQNSMVVFMIFQ